MAERSTYRTRIFTLCELKKTGTLIRMRVPLPKDYGWLNRLQGWTVYLGGTRVSHGRIGVDFVRDMGERERTGLVVQGVLSFRGEHPGAVQSKAHLLKSQLIILSKLDAEGYRFLGDKAGVTDKILDLRRLSARVARALQRDMRPVLKLTEPGQPLSRVQAIIFDVSEDTSDDVDFLAAHRRVRYTLVRDGFKIEARQESGWPSS